MRDRRRPGGGAGHLCEGGRSEASSKILTTSQLKLSRPCYVFVRDAWVYIYQEGYVKRSLDLLRGAEPAPPRSSSSLDPLFSRRFLDRLCFFCLCPPIPTPATGLGFRFWVRGSGAGVSGFGFRISGLGFRVEDPPPTLHVLHAASTLRKGLVFRVWSFGCQISGFWPRVPNPGLRVSGFELLLLLYYLYISFYLSIYLSIYLSLYIYIYLGRPSVAPR